MRFLRELGELADVAIGVDDATLFRNGWRLNTPVRIKLENVSVRGALQAALRPLELDLVVKENYLWVTQAAASEPTHLTRYPIDDLISKAEPAADAELLAAQVQRAVPAERWAGGKVDIVPGALLIAQSSGVHDELIVWFEKLRVARGLPLRTKYDPANALLRRFAPQRFALTTRWELAEPLLSKSVTASFPEPENTPRDRRDPGAANSSNVLVGFPRSRSRCFSPESTTTLTVESAALGKALEQLLEPLGLTVVPLDDTSLLLTTKTAAARRQITERYNIARLLEQRRWPMEEAAITDAIRQELNTRKLELAETVPMSWDRASRTLAVSASPVVHRVIADILGQTPQKPWLPLQSLRNNPRPQRQANATACRTLVGARSTFRARVRDKRHWRGRLRGRDSSSTRGGMPRVPGLAHRASDNIGPCRRPRRNDTDSTPTRRGSY